MRDCIKNLKKTGTSRKGIASGFIALMDSKSRKQKKESYTNRTHHVDDTRELPFDKNMKKRNDDSSHAS